MNDREFRNRLNQDLPDAPEIFHRAMTDTLKTTVREEGKRRAASARKLRRTLRIAALITLLLASAAVAAAAPVPAAAPMAATAPMPAAASMCSAVAM